MDNPYALTDPPNHTETDAPSIANDVSGRPDMDDLPSDASLPDGVTVDPVDSSIAKAPLEDLAASPSVILMDLPVDEDATVRPSGLLEADVTPHPRSPDHIRDTFTLDQPVMPPNLEARSDTQSIEPETGATALNDEAAIPPTERVLPEFTPDSSLASKLPTPDPDSVDAATYEDEDEDDTDNPTARAAEATMNISLAALGDTIRQQIEGREQEVGQRLSLLYAQRAELTERLAATGDTAANTPSPQQGL